MTVAHIQINTRISHKLKTNINMINKVMHVAQCIYRCVHVPCVCLIYLVSDSDVEVIQECLIAI